MMRVFIYCFGFIIPTLATRSNSLENISPVDIFSSSSVYQGADRKLDTIIGELTKARDEIRQVKNRIKFVGAKHLKTEELPCKDKDESKYYVIQNCGNHTEGHKHYFAVDGDHEDSKNNPGICRIIIPRVVTSDSYKISARMYNNVGPMGVNSGRLGLAYNVEDEFNFDFVIISLHQHEKCYRSGFLQNGKVVWLNGQMGPCPEGPPKGRQWFKLMLQVHESEAVLYINGVQVTNLVPHFTLIGRGGVVVATGGRNMVKFKHYNISSINKSQFKFLSCRSYSRIGESYILMEALEGDWPASGFCRAISKVSKQRENYAISVSLYNQGESTARDGGLLGVIYNVQNYYNYDFIYFRPNTRGGCFTTGFVQNSQIQWMNSKVGPCPGGPRTAGEWFNVTVEVRGARVAINIEGKHVITTQSHFSTVGRGGVLMANGNKNAAVFRNFNFRAIPPHPFFFHNCARSTKEIEDYFILDAKHGTWPEHTFCKAIAKTTVSGKHYFMAAEIFMQGTLAGRETDYAGIIFNVENENNYDFAYLTPHGFKFCFKAGFVLNGDIQWSSIVEGKCPGAHPKNGEWLQLEVSVSNEDAMISLEGRHLITYKPHYPAIGKTGIIVGNGFRNVLSFRGFVMYETVPLPFSFHTCGDGTHVTNGSTILDASLPHARPMSFCRAISKGSFNSSALKRSYVIEATLFNIDSWQGGDYGNLGLVYNAKDKDNFDFVFLNLDSQQDECYQFGAMFNGVPRFNKDYTGGCAVRPPTGKWFTLKLDVKYTSNKVKMILDGKSIGEIKSSSPFAASGGVLVPNGYKNVIMFRDFIIKGGGN